MAPHTPIFMQKYQKNIYFIKYLSNVCFICTCIIVLLHMHFYKLCKNTSKKHQKNYVCNKDVTITLFLKNGGQFERHLGCLKTPKNYAKVPGSLINFRLCKTFWYMTRVVRFHGRVPCSGGPDCHPNRCHHGVMKINTAIFTCKNSLRMTILKKIVIVIRFFFLLSTRVRYHSLV